jgi:hypothetical protein
MTASRAAIIALMGRYLATSYGYRLSLVEVQKLAYFLQEAGEPLKLQFKAHFYGPYADDLRKALRNIEGHYTRGLADGKNSPETPLEILPGVLEAAESVVAQMPASLARFERVARLIDGFETPFGMELLGTVHWLANHETRASRPDAVVANVRGWNARKRSQMKEGHILAAFARLREQEWMMMPAPRFVGLGGRWNQEDQWRRRESNPGPKMSPKRHLRCVARCLGFAPRADCGPSARGASPS